MKKSILLGCLLLWGCRMAPSGKIEVFGEATDKTGDHKLVLRFVEVERVPRGHDFHSLAWETRDGVNWTEKLVILRAAFQKGHRLRRWVSQVHSFDGGTGRAILRVGEEGPPDEAGSMHVTYSWREWDVANNQEVRLVRVCQHPFEPFEKGKDGK